MLNYLEQCLNNQVAILTVHRIQETAYVIMGKERYTKQPWCLMIFCICVIRWPFVGVYNDMIDSPSLYRILVGGLKEDRYWYTGYFRCLCSNFVLFVTSVSAAGMNAAMYVMKRFCYLFNSGFTPLALTLCPRFTYHPFSHYLIKVP